MIISGFSTSLSVSLSPLGSCSLLGVCLRTLVSLLASASPPLCGLTLSEGLNRVVPCHPFCLFLRLTLFCISFPKSLTFGVLLLPTIWLLQLTLSPLSILLFLLFLLFLMYLVWALIRTSPLFLPLLLFLVTLLSGQTLPLLPGLTWFSRSKALTWA